MAEITAPVELCLPGGLLNPAAVGWSRHPLVDTDSLGRQWYRWGRTKRWEYWGVITPSHVVAMTISDLDYAAVHQVFWLDRSTGERVEVAVTRPLGGGTSLPGTLGRGPARGSGRGLAIAVDDDGAGPGSTSRLRARTDRLLLDVLAHRAPDHEGLAVVVPWSRRLFQYTVKDLAQPVTGRLRVDGVDVELPAGRSWAVLDHGRGRWPYAMTWNWAAGCGVVDGKAIGVQLGGRWTDGTGSTENALVVDGRVHHVGADLIWSYDRADWMAPWQVRGPGVDVVFTPEHERVAATDLGVVASSTHQCFGTFSGWMADDAGRRHSIDGVEGWAEEADNRW